MAVRASAVLQDGPTKGRDGRINSTCHHASSSGGSLSGTCGSGCLGWLSTRILLGLVHLVIVPGRQARCPSTVVVTVATCVSKGQLAAQGGTCLRSVVRSHLRCQ